MLDCSNFVKMREIRTRYHRGRGHITRSFFSETEQNTKYENLLFKFKFVKLYFNSVKASNKKNIKAIVFRFIYRV